MISVIYSLVFRNGKWIGKSDWREEAIQILLFYVDFTVVLLFLELASPLRGLIKKTPPVIRWMPELQTTS